MTLAVVLLVASLALVQAYPATNYVASDGLSLTRDEAGQVYVSLKTHDGGHHEYRSYLALNPLDGTLSPVQEGHHSSADGQTVYYKSNHDGYRSSATPLN